MQFLRTKEFWICALAALVMSAGLSYFVVLPECVLFSALVVTAIWAMFRMLAWHAVTFGERTRFAIVFAAAVLGFAVDLAAWRGHEDMLFRPVERRITEKVGREIAAEIAGDSEFNRVRFEFQNGRKAQWIVMSGTVDSKESWARLDAIVENHKLPEEDYSRVTNRVEVAGTPSAAD